MRRRSFLRLCSAAAAAAAAGPLLADGAAFVPRARARLVGADGSPLRAGALALDEPYLFHYPFRSTPCLLLRLGRPVRGPVSLHTAEGRAFRWAGGVGPGGAVVAFSAICTHLMTHPRRDGTFIAFHRRPTEVAGRPYMITCCAHGSVFDPHEGARVVTGPATQPLTAIILEHDPATDALTAVGTAGADLYREFLRTFRRELRAEFGRSAYRARVEGEARVQRLAEYAGRIFSC